MTSNIRLNVVACVSVKLLMLLPRNAAKTIFRKLSASAEMISKRASNANGRFFKRTSATLYKDADGKGLCKKFKDQRPRIAKKCKFKHACDVKLLATNEACGATDHSRDQHDYAKHGAAVRPHTTYSPFQGTVLATSAKSALQLHPLL